MGRDQGNQNIYLRARIKASEHDRRFANRERASEELFVSAGALENYERGATLPPCDVVQRMIEVYDAPDLKRAHVSMHCPIISDYAPDTGPLAEAALEWVLHTASASEIAMKFAAIARDNQITPDELHIAELVRQKAVDIKNVMEATITAIDKARIVGNREGGQGQQ